MELLRLAWPLIVSNGFMTLQMTIDRIFLSRHNSNEVAAAMPAVMIFWTLFALPQNIVNYVTTFVAQYLGAGRPQRVGPVVWQSLYLSVALGLAFLALAPLAPLLLALGEHTAELQELEVIFFRCLCWSALPALLVAAVSAFFAGRGDSGTVMVLNAVGMIVNAALDYVLIFGNFGFPEMGIAGAGWATVIGNSVSALLGLALLFRRRYEAEHGTRSGWPFDAELMRRLLRFGVPNGLQWALDGLAFSLFVILVGRLGRVELAATSIAVTLNLLAFLPTMGVGQAVAILVGQRLGEDRPDVAERTTWSGFQIGWLLMVIIAAMYVIFPQTLLAMFQSTDEAGQWSAIAATVPVLLRFVAVYCLFDSMNLIFSFALRGAGDTVFVTAAAVSLSWPLMVVPTWAAWYFGWGLYWSWSFASAYIIVLGFVLLKRFRGGRWKSMRVIEMQVAGELCLEESETSVPLVQ
jgi:MATE family multidrug resistance protein